MFNDNQVIQEISVTEDAFYLIIGYCLYKTI